MRRFGLLLFICLAAGGGWMFLQHFQVEGLEYLKVRPRQPGATSPGTATSTAPPVQRAGGTIRIATFNIQVLGTAKLAKPRVVDILAQVARRFDVLAIQEVRSKTQDVLPRLIDAINAGGRKYDFVIGPRLGRTSSKEQYAFVFDTASVEVDRQALYTVGDPDDQLHREPLVAWFRVRGPPPDQAFTFSLVDVHTDPDEAAKEIDVLADVYRAVRDDRRGEDDVLLLGDFNADDYHYGRLAALPQIAWVLSSTPTNTRGDKMYDNIVFTRTATTEFTGRAGVLDLVREFNLTLDEALDVSDHFPVWAEFSILEGGQPGRIAARPQEPPQ
jgi:deoxyribonuclease-1-like protein